MNWKTEKYREWHRAYARRWRKRNPKSSKLSDRKSDLKRIGATIELFNSILEKQKGLCAICSCDFAKDNKKPVLDHDHKTGKIREILCQNCNMQLGHIERVKIKKFLFMEQAINYLNKHSLGAKDVSDKEPKR
jgi:hypothetical protein